MRALQAKQSGEAVQHQTFDDDDAERQRYDGGEVTEQDIEVNAGADRDEKQAKQQALEGFDVGFELVAIFAVGQHDTGEEGAECRRQVDQGHQQRDTDHQQQGTRGKDLTQARRGDETKHRA